MKSSISRRLPGSGRAHHAGSVAPRVGASRLSVEVRWNGADPVPMIWYGENLFWAPVRITNQDKGVQVCATDRAGNEACSSE